jgi:Secretion system C-terminal sorting domain
MRTPVTAFPCRTLSMLRSIVAGILLLACLSPVVARAQSKDDFRSGQSGKWSKKGTWERFDGSTWINAPNVPNKNDGQITIRAGHTVTVDKRYTIDETVLQNGATLKVDKRLTIIDGPGTDFSSLGAIEIKDKLRSVRTASVSFGSTSVVDVKGGTLQFQQSSTATMLSGSTVNVQAGSNLFVSGSARLTLDAGSVVNNFDRFRTNGTASLIVAGTIVNHSRLLVQQSGTATFINSGVYEHARNAGALPSAARTSFNVGSTMLVSGVTDTLPTQLNNTFYNFTWNSPLQTSILNLGAGPQAISGDFSVVTTGTSSLSWVQNANSAMSIGGSYIQTGGTFFYANGSGSGSMSVLGNTNLTGGILNLSSGSGNPTLDLSGDLLVSGGQITTTGAGQGTVRFSGSSVQSVDAPAGIAGNLDALVANTGGIRLLDSFSGPKSITVTSGSLDLNNFDLTVGANLTVATSIVSPAAIQFVGTGIQNLTYTPGLLTLPELVLDNAGGSLVTGTDLVITATASVRNGIWNTNGRSIVFNAGATLFNAGTVSGNVTFSRFYGLNADGWRMIATPVNGVTYGSLNGVFHTQGGSWATLSGGTSNLQSLNFSIQDWSEIKGTDAVFTGSEGYIFYMFKDDRNGNPVLPATWSVTGSVRNVASRNLSFNTNSTDSYNYVGNPTTSNLDWNSVVATSSNVGSSYATWDPSLTPDGGMTGYKYYSAASGVGAAGRYIAPFTAMMVQPLAAGATIQFPTSEAANRQSASQFGKSESVSSFIQLGIRGAGRAETETYLVFDDAASPPSDDFDSYDVDRLSPLSAEYVTIWSVVEDQKLAFDGRNMSAGREVYDLAIDASEKGTYEFTWPMFFDIPETWTITLNDRKNGNSIDMRTRTSYLFELESAEIASAKLSGLQTSDLPPRFTLIVRDPLRSDAEEILSEVLPTSPTLVQNYPNPFTSSTTIRVSLTETSRVHLEIYDILGRSVAVLENATRDAGWREYVWRPTSQVSGIYFYRLRVAGHDITRSMILAR